MSIKTTKKVHQSGPLAHLLNSNQIKNHEEVKKAISTGAMPSSLEIETESGLKFKTNELLEINTDACQPWEYANRSDEELGDLEGLISSIKENGQLQPILVRHANNDKSSKKFEVIFGRRRYLACKELGIKVLAILKDIPKIEDAVLYQYDENKNRNDVSDYSNAVLYKKLLDNRCFTSAKELAAKLSISKGAFAELMTFTKLPKSIVSLIPDIHNVKIYMANAIWDAIKTHGVEKVEFAAPLIGSKIKTPANLQAYIKSYFKDNETIKAKTLLYKNKRTDETLFTVKANSKGILTLHLSKELSLRDNIGDKLEQVSELLSE